MDHSGGYLVSGTADQAAGAVSLNDTALYINDKLDRGPVHVSTTGRKRRTRANAVVSMVMQQHSCVGLTGYVCFDR
ncbi:MAG: hypothetical protein ACJARS_000674 [bacterium]|jgi:hypothetical protein